MPVTGLTCSVSPTRRPAVMATGAPRRSALPLAVRGTPASTPAGVSCSMYPAAPGEATTVGAPPLPAGLGLSFLATAAPASAAMHSSATASSTLHRSRRRTRRDRAGDDPGPPKLARAVRTLGAA